MVAPRIEPPRTWRGRLWLWLRHQAAASLTDYRYPRAVAAVLTLVVVILAMALTWFGVDRVLNRLDQRAEYSECVDDREVAFEVALIDLLLADSHVPPLTPEQLISRRDALVIATDALRNVDALPAAGGCPGRSRVRADTSP